MFWQIASFPKCLYHAFLSHCQEDRAALVRPVYDRLLDVGVAPWLDQEDYYYGRDSRTALRDGVLRSRHIVFFVTDAMLSVARGWCVFELAFAELIELNFRVTGGQTANAFLPLYLVPQSDDRLPRTVWQSTRDRGRFYSPGDGDPVDWSVKQITEFLVREQQLSKEFAKMASKSRSVRSSLERTPGLTDRVTRFHPRRITI